MRFSFLVESHQLKEEYSLSGIDPGQMFIISQIFMLRHFLGSKLKIR
jgi:hypothetical protein